jgi:hypothetical protein
LFYSILLHFGWDDIARRTWASEITVITFRSSSPERDLNKLIFYINLNWIIISSKRISLPDRCFYSCLIFKSLLFQILCIQFIKNIKPIIFIQFQSNSHHLLIWLVNLFTIEWFSQKWWNGNLSFSLRKDERKMLTYYFLERRRNGINLEKFFHQREKMKKYCILMKKEFLWFMENVKCHQIQGFGK